MHRANSMSAELRNFVDSLKIPFNLNSDNSRPNVIAVLDEFSTLSFSSSLNLWLIDPIRPEIDFSFINPDFLLVESAWSGNSGRWRYMVTSTTGPKDPLIKLIEKCRQRGIPTVFWNKEDPPHFEEFIETARLFDYVFTSDANMIDRYNSRVPGLDAELLRFAASPKIHNPRRTSDYRMGNFAFAGQYFRHKFPERREQMEQLFPVASKYGLDIYSRALGGDENYQFPEPFDKMVVGSLPYERMVEAYKDYKAFINVNSVVNSETMCARRVFELSACKTSVLGMASKAIESVYSDDEIKLANSPSEVEDVCELLAEDEPARQLMAQRAWRKTLSHHTYEHRVQQMLEKVGISMPEISYHVHLSCEHDAPFVESFVQAQTFTFSEKVHFFFDGKPLNHRLEESMETNRGSTPKIIELFAKISSKYAYGAYYLNDLILALKQTELETVAKTLLSSAQAPETELFEYLPDWGFLTRSKSVVSGDDDMHSVYFSDYFELQVAKQLN